MEAMKQIRFTLNKSLFFALAVLVFSSCASTEKMMDEGRYDELIHLAKRKLSGKKKKNAKYVAAAEEAFNRANARDLALINSLKKRDDLRSWDEVYEIANNIALRQNKLSSLLPLVDKHGYTANFEMINTDPIMIEAGEMASTILYDLGTERLEEAEETKEKLAARAAFNHFENIDKYVFNFKDVKDLKRRAHELGITRVMVSMQNESSSIIPGIYEKELLELNFGKLKDFWNEYYTYAPESKTMDYSVVFYLRDIQVSPELLRESSKEYSTRVKDGFEYVLDENGNVQKDTSGNDIKVDRFVNVNARLLEIFQEKRSEIRGQIVIYDLKEEQQVGAHSVNVNSVFENSAHRVFGDRRALRGVRYNAGDIIPFPSNEEMILRTADEIKPIIIRRIRKSRLI